MVAGQLKELSERLYEGQLANLEDVETFHCRIDTANNEVAVIKDMTTELANCVKCKNTKPGHLLAKNNPKSREQFFKVNNIEPIIAGASESSDAIAHFLLCKLASLVARFIFYENNKKIRTFAVVRQNYPLKN